MPAYAILGATGKTGNALFNLLLKDSTTKVNCYLRSKSKLLSQFPNIDSNPSMKIFEGALNNIPLLASCISDVDAIFCVLGENENTPGIRIAQDGAQSIVAALCHLGLTNGADMVPKVITLSSATINPKMAGDLPIPHGLLMTALSNAYADLARAEEYLRLHESWLRVTYAQPGGLVEDEQRGHALSLDRKGAEPFVSYWDLAAGMIEIAESGEYNGVGVSIVATSKDVKFEWNAPKQLTRGLVWHYAPSIGSAAKYIGVF